MKRKIIIVDDHAMYRNTLKVVLKASGDVEIIGEAANGEEFLELLKTNNPDIVFMDIEMPEMNGIKATELALQRNPSLVIIGLSFYNNADYIDSLINCGARGYLVKSNDNHEIFKRIIQYPRSDIFMLEEPPIQKKESNNVKSILIVDDFKTNVIVMSSALKMAGFNVISANNGMEALDILKKGNNINLIVTDFRMPGMNGAELTAEIKKLPEHKKTPVLILSSETDVEKKVEAKNAGATGWIKKPFIIEKFLRIVETAMQ